MAGYMLCKKDSLCYLGLRFGKIADPVIVLFLFIISCLNDPIEGGWVASQSTHPPESAPCLVGNASKSPFVNRR